MLQAVINGFGGLDITPEGIVQRKATLPSGWKSLKLIGVGSGDRTFEVRSDQ